MNMDASDPSPSADEAVAAPPEHRRWRAVISVGGLVIVVVVALLLVLTWGVLRQRQEGGSFGGFGINAIGQIGRIQPGPAPDFTLRLYDGGSFRLADHRGQVVVVNFWASWCPPCRDEAPVLERAWQQQRGQGVVLVGADVWDKDQDARNFMSEFHVDYPTGPEPGGATAIDYGVTGLPETFFVRPDGTVSRHWIGPLNDQQISAFIDEARQ